MISNIYLRGNEKVLAHDKEVILYIEFNFCCQLERGDQGDRQSEGQL